MISRKWPKRLLIAVSVLAALTAGVWLWHVGQRNEIFERALPAEFETTGLAIAGDDLGLLVHLIAWPVGMCGGAVFHLSLDTLDKIDKQGLAFFDKARKVRSYLGYPSGRNITYEPWQETPIPSWIGNKEDRWWGLDCIETSSDLPRRIGQEARKSGSYFTSRRYARLVVVPKLRVIVITFHPNE